MHICAVCVVWLWSGPTQSVMCVSAEHKAVCSKTIRPERVNTLPREPLTHDPAGLSAPLNMTIHPLYRTRVCVCFPFLDALVHMHECLSPYIYLCARKSCIIAIVDAGPCADCVLWCDGTMNWLISALGRAPCDAPRGLICMDMCGNQNKDQ